MRRFAAYLIALAALVCAVPAVAQEDGDDDAGFLERLVQDSLSAPGQTVRVRGFEGVLSAQARLGELTIADAEGVWLTLRNAQLDWTRTALLRGRLEVDSLSAEELIVSRPPIPAEPEAPELPSPVAQGFSLPELPVSVRIGAFAIAHAEIGAPVLGQALTATLSGNATLADGEGAVALALERTDGQAGQLALEGAFSNATRELVLDLGLSEAEGGVAASKLGLPGEPSVDLAIAGTGPLSDFTADIRLATAGQDRLTGRVVLTETEDATPAFRADLSGDIRPLLAEDYRDFFGREMALAVSGQRDAEGSTLIDRLALSAAELQLQGAAEIAPDGLPRRLALDGTVASADGGPVLLPIPGARTEIDRATLTIAFDADAGEAWESRIAVDGLNQPDFAARQVVLDGSGEIGRSAAGNRVQASFDFSAAGLASSDPAVNQAMGDRLDGRAEIRWQTDDPVRIDLLQVSGKGLSVTAAGEIDGLDSALSVAGEAALSVADIAEFSALAGRPLGGGADVTLTGSGAVLDGTLNLTLAGESRDLRLGIAQLDPLLAGVAEAALTLRRDATGTYLDDLGLTSDRAEITASAALGTGAQSLALTAALTDLSDVLEGVVAGPANVSLRAEDAEGQDVWDVTARATAPGGAEFRADGTLSDPLGEGRFAGALSAAVARLAAYAGAAGQPLGGGIDARAEGMVTISTLHFDVTASAEARDVTTGIAQADALLAGTAEVTLAARRNADGVVLDQLQLQSPRAELDASAALGSGAQSVALDASLTDLADVLADVAGPAQVTLRADDSAGRDVWELTARASGPGGATLSADGTLSDPMGAQRFEGAVSAAVARLATFASAAGLPLGGGIEARIDGSVTVSTLDFDATVAATTRNVTTGIAQADALLRGQGQLTLAAAGTPGAIEVSRLTVRTPQLDAQAAGQLAEGRGALDYQVRLANVGLLVPGFPGAATAEGSVAQLANGDWRLRLDATGPGGIAVRASGTAAQDFGRLALDLSGNAPSELANTALAPNAVAGTVRFDLRLDGPPALNSLSGRVSLADGRFDLAQPRATLTGLNARVQLAGGRAQVSASAAVDSGGRLTVEGPVTMSPPFGAGLAITAQGVVLSDPSLYETNVDARLRVDGPLTGGAGISGLVTIGPTEIKVPSGALGGAAAIPEIAHVGAPASVQRTRLRAGLIETGGSGVSGGGAVFGLDITVRAPNQIFVRGRGLDAEFGGEIRLGGTTANVIPSGQFSLFRGRFDFLGKRLELDEADVSLRGALVPYLRLLARNESEDATIFIGVEGPADAPEFSFYAEPELPEDEVLSRFLFGKGIETLSLFQAAELAAATAQLTGRGAGIGQRLRESIGLDDLDTRRSTGGGAGLGAGAYLNENVYTDLSLGTDSSEVTLNLDITSDLKARGSVDSKGETGLGIFFERDY